MTTNISPLAHVDPRAEFAEDVCIGPFCSVGPDVRIGNRTVLESHVVIKGRTTIGERNRFFPHTVIGGEPQDISYRESDTSVIIGNDNIFREGVTVNRGAEKEDHVTRINNCNMLMANSHVAHNCHIFDNVILVNGVLLGGHVHVHDGAIVSGNSVVHHFSTLGALSFVSGGCRVPHDVPPFMLAAGSDKPTIRTINSVGMRRFGIAEETIGLVKTAFRMLFRQNKSLGAARSALSKECDGLLPLELTRLLDFVERQRKGKLGRAREAVRATDPATGNSDQDRHRRAA